MKIDIDKIKEKFTATAASAKELISKENISKASSRIAALKTKEGRQAFIADIKAMPPRGKVALSAIAAGLVIVLFCIGSCLFSGKRSERQLAEEQEPQSDSDLVVDSHLDERLGANMTQYVMGWQKLQARLDTAVAKLERGEGSEEPDLIIRHREATKAAKNIAKYVKETTVPGRATEMGKEVAALIKDIATIQSNLWDRLHHVMPLAADSAEQTPASDAKDNKRDLTSSEIGMQSTLLDANPKDLAGEIDWYRERYGDGEGDRHLAEMYKANTKFMFKKANRKLSKYAGMPEELAEKMVKDIEADLDYMASDERYKGQLQRKTGAYRAAFDSDADKARGDNYNKLQEYDEFKQNALIAARKQSDELKTKMQKLKSLLAAPTGD